VAATRHARRSTPTVCPRAGVPACTRWALRPAATPATVETCTTRLVGPLGGRAAQPMTQPDPRADRRRSQCAIRARAGGGPLPSRGRGGAHGQARGARTAALAREGRSRDNTRLPGHVPKATRPGRSAPGRLGPRRYPRGPAYRWCVSRKVRTRSATCRWLSVPRTIP